MRAERRRRRGAGLHQGPVLVDRGVERVHQGLAERGDDVQPFGVELLRRVAVGLLELIEHRLHDVAAVTAPAVVEGLDDRGELRLGRVLLRQRAHAGHGVDHVVPAEDQGLVTGAVLGVGAVAAGALDHGGDHRGLGGRDLVDLRGGQAEVVLGGRADPVRATAEVDGVQVLLEDLLLGRALGQLLGDEDLFDLAGHGLRRADVGVVVPDQLLGDRRPALQVPAGAGEVVVGRPQDAARRDAALVPEVLVLRGDHGVAEHGRDLAVEQLLAVDGAELPDPGLVVAEVDDGRGLGRGQLGIGGDRGLRVGDPHARGAENHHDPGRDGGDADRLLQGPVPPPVALAVLPAAAIEAVAAAVPPRAPADIGLLQGGGTTRPPAPCCRHVRCRRPVAGVAVPVAAGGSVGDAGILARAASPPRPACARRADPGGVPLTGGGIALAGGGGPARADGGLPRLPPARPRCGLASAGAGLLVRTTPARLLALIRAAPRAPGPAAAVVGGGAATAARPAPAAVSGGLISPGLVLPPARVTRALAPRGSAAPRRAAATGPVAAVLRCVCEPASQAGIWLV